MSRRPFYLYPDKHSGIMYVQFTDPVTGNLTSAKSTGTRDRKEAEKTAIRWSANGSIPNRINSARQGIRTAEVSDILKMLSITDLKPHDAKLITDHLKRRGLLISAVLTSSPESRLVKEYFTEFWTYDASPYVREKLHVGQSIHRRHINEGLQRCIKYWIPEFGERPIGSMTLDDVQNFMFRLIDMKKTIVDPDGKKQTVSVLSAQTVNQIIRVGTEPLKYAYQKHLIENDCFSGLSFCAVESTKREILQIEDAKKVFAAHWTNESYKLGNMTAMFTGMRIGEILALQKRDLGTDRIYVRHNWADDDGLKSTKNGDEREIPVPAFLLEKLKAQADSNPWNQGDAGYVFYSTIPSKPLDRKPWPDALRRVLKELNIPNYEKITFHSWRHFYATNMADHVDNEHKLQQLTGHKTKAMLEHYAAHQSEATLQELGKTAEALFLPIISA